MKDREPKHKTMRHRTLPIEYLRWDPAVFAENSEIQCLGIAEAISDLERRLAEAEYLLECYRTGKPIPRRISQSYR